MIQNVVGSPATGGNFFGRTAEQTRLWRAFRTDNVLLLAPRRVGKTSLLKRLSATAPEHDFRAIYMSVSHEQNELDFLRALYKAVAASGDGASVLKRAYSALRLRIPDLPKVDKITVAGLFSVDFAEAHSTRWRMVGEALFDTLRSADGQWLVMVDEVPRFVMALVAQDRDRAKAFLNWFRDLRIAEATQSVRWVLCGSIGLDTVTRRERIGDTINDLRIVRLGPFSRSDAEGLFDGVALTEGLHVDPEARTLALDRLGWLIPYHVQVLIAAMVDSGRVDIDAAAVASAYEQLLEPAHKSYFDYWSQRLVDELGRVDAEHALAALALVAADDDGASDDTLNLALFGRGIEAKEQVRFLLDVLETDGYIVRVDGRSVFRSTLLRDYWRARIL